MSKFSKKLILAFAISIIQCHGPPMSILPIPHGHQHHHGHHNHHTHYFNKGNEADHQHAAKNYEFKNVTHEHSHLAMSPVHVVPAKPVPKPIVHIQKTPIFRKPFLKKPIFFEQKPLPYMPGFKWNNYTNKKEE